MAALHFLLLLLTFATTLSPSSSRTLPSTTSQEQSLAAAPQTLKPGPIETNGKNYTKVCDPDRFTDLGLNMNDFAYCDKSLPYAQRVKDLIGRMTLFEKALQLGDKASGVERIGLPKYRWWAEALHGVAETGPATYFGDIVPYATSFPNVILTAATFNESLWKKIGQVVSTEGRAMYNLGHTGLTFWSPNINVARDPRWGRNLETPGEDPFLVGRYSVQFVRGMQDVEGSETAQDLNARPLKVSTCCKHYAAYDVDNWFFVDRQHFDARVKEQDLVETFNRPFETCVREGDASSIMCSFNRINGVPVCADTRLMSQTFRDDWQLHGYIVSDCDSIEVMIHGQKWLGDSPVEAVSQTFKSGLDLDCGWGPINYYVNYTVPAVAQGKVRESDVDNALKNLYTVLMRLGFFDGNQQYESLGVSDICTSEHIELSVDAARQGIVLLKNNATLPLDPKKLSNVALVGPHVHSTAAMIGNYAGKPCKYTSPSDAISKDVKVDVSQGCDNVLCSNAGNIGKAVEAAKKAAATIIVVGLNLDVEAEQRDRMSLRLPGNQEQLITRVADASAGPVVLVILSGGCVDVSLAKNHPKIGAIIWAGYPGPEGGQALADVIFGRYNPAGRLPLTFYTDDYVLQLPMTSMQLRPNDELGYPGRTYKFFNGTALYPFGHGLSYTTFKYATPSTTTSCVTVNVGTSQFCKPLTYKPGVNATACPALNVAEIPCEEEISFSVDVSNTGSVEGSHVVLVYSKPPPEVADAPIKQLVAYQRVVVPANSTSTLSFSLNACKALGLVEKTAYVVLPSGKSTIVVGNDDAAVSFPVAINFQI